MCRGLFFIERKSLTQVFSCGFCENFWGAFFIEYLGATAFVTKNMGATNKQHKMVDGRSDQTYVLFRMYNNAYTSSRRSMQTGLDPGNDKSKAN